MHTAPRGSRRHGVRSLPLVAVLTACATACGGGGGSSGRSIEFTPGAMQSVPALRPAASSSLTALVGSSSADSIRNYFSVAQLFAMQCRHSDARVNYCPPGTPGPSSTGDPYQLTMQSLIGFIFHAQMYTSFVTACSGDNLSPKSVTAASYAAGSTASGANPGKFVLDQYSSYTCRSTAIANRNAETRMISAVADGSYQTTLHTRYKYVAGDGQPQTDLFQVDVAMEAGAPTFLALNFASAAPFRSRLVLLANLATHRFALKYLTPSQPSNLPTWAPARFAVAVGTGGYDLATGTPNPGLYYVDFLDEPPFGELKRCADNTDGSMQADLAPCTAAGVPTQWATSDAIRNYLAVPAAHATRLAPFLALFQDATTLGVMDAWQNVGDEDLYWPASLR